MIKSIKGQFNYTVSLISLILIVQIQSGLAQKTYKCPPCNIPCDTLIFHEEGNCHVCGMRLLLQKSYLQEMKNLAQHPILSEISDAVSIENIQENIFWLADMTGGRLMGSNSYRKSVDYAVQQLQKFGVSSEQIQLEPFGENIRGWDLQSFQVEISIPFYEHLNAFPRAYVAPTPGEIEAEVILIPYSQNLEEYAGQLENKIVLIGDNYQSEASPTMISLWQRRLKVQELQKAQENQDPNNRLIGYYSKRSTPDAIQNTEKHYQNGEAQHNFLREQGALAVIEASRIDFGILHVDGWDFTPPLWNTQYNKALPSFVISNEAFGRIVRILQRDIPVQMKLNLEAKFNENVENNVQILADIEGSDPNLKEELVMMGAHLDAWHSSLGITDNVGNCALLMEVFRVLNHLEEKPKRTICLALWGGEEQNFSGSKSYIEKYVGNLDGTNIQEQQEKISAYFNLDNGLGKIRGIYLMGNDRAQSVFGEYLAPFSESQTLTLQYANQSDHELFDWMGIPGFQFIQDPLSYIPITHHTNLDVLEYADLEDLEYNATLLSYLIWQVANAEEKTPRKPYDLPYPIMDGKTKIHLEGYSDAQQVSVFADFNNWSLFGTKLQKVQSGWECYLDLPKGRYLYKFIVDNDYISPPNTSEYFVDEKGHAGLAELIVE